MSNPAPAGSGSSRRPTTPSAPTSHREVESKWRVHPPFVVPDLNTAEGVGSVAEPRIMRLKAVYWDTSDLRLARDGVTLRHRSGEGPGDGWHLKLPVTDAGVPDASTGVREELLVAGPPEAVPAELRDLVTPLARTSVLGPVATLITDRTVREVADGAGNAAVEVTDDLVSVMSGGHVAGRFREIEVETTGETGSDIAAAIGGLLRANGAVGGEFVPKVVRALGPQATAAPDPPPAERVAAKDPAHVAVRAILRRYVRDLLRADLSLRQAVAAEDGREDDYGNVSAGAIPDDAIHDLRVAARRIRSSLRTFSPLLDQSWAGGLGDELAWLADSLSKARDNEVMTTRLLDAVDRLPGDLVIGDVRERLRRRLGNDLSDGLDAALEALRDERYVVLLERLVDAAWEPMTSAAAEQSTEGAIPPLIRAEWRRLATRVRKAQGTTDPHRWHRARIAAKRTRYAAEAVAPIFGAPAMKFAKRVEAIQELLGEHQDAAVAKQLLLSAATAPRVGAVGFTLGLLHAHQDQIMTDTRNRFSAVWETASAARLRRWLRT